MQKADARICWGVSGPFPAVSTPTCLQAVRVVPANLWREIWWSPHGRICLTKQQDISKNQNLPHLRTSKDISSPQHWRKNTSCNLHREKNLENSKFLRNCRLSALPLLPISTWTPSSCASRACPIVPSTILAIPKSPVSFKAESWSLESIEIKKSETSETLFYPNSQIPCNQMEMLWIASKSPSFTVHWFKSPWRQVAIHAYGIFIL